MHIILFRHNVFTYQLQYSVNIIFVCIVKPKQLCDALYWIQALQQWSGTEPSLALRYATHTHTRIPYWFCFSVEPWISQVCILIVPILNIRKLRLRDVQFWDVFLKATRLKNGQASMETLSHYRVWDYTWSSLELFTLSSAVCFTD